jgi:hypothetical protein
MLKLSELVHIACTESIASFQNNPEEQAILQPEGPEHRLRVEIGPTPDEHRADTLIKTHIRIVSTRNDFQTSATDYQSVLMMTDGEAKHWEGSECSFHYSCIESKTLIYSCQHKTKPLSGLSLLWFLLQVLVVSLLVPSVSNERQRRRTQDSERLIASTMIHQ